MISANEIRSKFLDYFSESDHSIVDSSPLVPLNDPTLMFTNAGMVQFKNLFTGQETRDYSRATTSQKCVRAGGKHNDLENVGCTARHHTFFEMLGNFSFGDYFKEQAIELAWNLLTKEFGLDKDKLLITIYHDDNEAADYWKKIAGIGDDKIIRIATSDNFWSMGDTGPCGPCSEIFYDHGPSIWGGPPGSPDEDGDRFIEIWNLVFMQFEQMESGERVNLPSPSIDTGMGLERVAALLQGKHDNYDTDLMRSLIEDSAEKSNVDADGPHNVSHRVIADHLRSSAFLIADGVLPSNEGRGYVLRRIMRRAMRHAHMIGCNDLHMHKLVPALVDEMGGHFKELGRAKSLIEETLKLEENRFKTTLERGLHLLEQETNKLGDKEALSGNVAFKLYDTFGFPLDLTQDILRGQERGLDKAGFDAAMDAQKTAARATWKGSGSTATESLWFELKDEQGATEFLGYTAEKAEGQVTALIVDGKRVESANVGDKVDIIVNQTPFYGESGGQQGDAGFIQSRNVSVRIDETQKKLGDLWIHSGEVVEGTLNVGDPVELVVDHSRRSSLRQHHSATHLMHEALRRFLGDHVAQKGSMVAADRLRFDFSHTKPMTDTEIADVERMVNDRVLNNSEVTTRLMTPDEAIEEGAMALFGEKYGEEVRVVSMGGVDANKNDGRFFSTELCGGTHVSRTGDIGLVKLIREEGMAAGVRRVEAVAGLAALEAFNRDSSLLTELSTGLKVAPADLPERISSLQEERKKLEREITSLRKKLATGGGDGAGAEVKDIAGVKFSGRVLEDVPAKDLKGMADEIKKQIGSGVVALISVSEGKASVVVGVTDDQSGEHSAVDLVRVASAALGGKGGGGRPDMAQAGGPDGSKAAEALTALEATLAG
ncbi:alanine--tRNA ligase [Alphaproteobacteria bacterium]|nr:alanine--tRNA ligase [Alphaproteobacteria bacterium]